MKRARTTLITPQFSLGQRCQPCRRWHGRLCSISPTSSETWKWMEITQNLLSKGTSYLGWPPMSQSLMVTLPFVIFLMLKPTVGIMSWRYKIDLQDNNSDLCFETPLWIYRGHNACITSLNWPEAIRLTKVVLPACWKIHRMFNEGWKT